MKRGFIILPLISVLFFIFASCGDKFLTADGTTWGTTYHIVYRGNAALADSIVAELRSIDAELSLFNPESTVSLVNDCKTDSVGPRFVELIELSKRVCALSDGVYDPTVGPLCDIWGFGKSDFNGVPSPEVIAEALATVGIMDCFVSPEGKITKKTPGTEFDFSSIAKGYGIDCIGRMFERNGVSDYLIEIGGEVLVCGANAQGRPWHIQIDSPEGGMGHSALEIKELGPCRSAIASSGNYRNFRTDSAGISFGHTISPVTGRPAVTSVLSASVCAGDCALADALATACIASGNASAAMDILYRAGVSGLIVYADSVGNIVTERVGDF